ncbi:MAG: hypothetical protein GX157_06230 [Candidatus Cloacimonetes bacterium]|nr:hypothetical protein [Candidatus Cloacimonadota bacterium]
MFLLPFLSGTMSLLSPFLGMILVMYFSAKVLGPALVSPQRTIILFFVMPILVLMIDGRHGDTPLIAFDAIFGVGLVVYVFLLTLRRNQVLSEALLAGILVIVVYSLARMYIFGGILSNAYQEGMQIMKEQMPVFLDNEYMQFSTRMWETMMPAFWGVGQIFALLIGYFIFHRTIHIPFVPGDVKFTVFFNILILAALPLYLFEATKALFINSLILLCTVPLIQGFFLAWTHLSRVVSNNIIKRIIMFVLLIYAFIPLILIGFADSWMTGNNTRGGNTA